MKPVLNGRALCLSLLLCVGLAAGCADEGPAGGYRKVDDVKRLLRLSEEGKFVMNSGDAGTYQIYGRRIIIRDVTFGDAEGVIEGDTIVFPESILNETAKNAAGIWEKI